MYEYFDAERPPSGPCALRKPNSINDILSPAAILYRTALVVIKLKGEK